MNESELYEELGLLRTVCQSLRPGGKVAGGVTPLTIIGTLITVSISVKITIDSGIK